MMINPDILDAYITNSECRSALGGNPDALRETAKKKEKKSRERFIASLSERAPDDCFTPACHDSKPEKSNVHTEEYVGASSSSSSAFLFQNSKKKKKKKDKKKAKKRRKESAQLLGYLDDNLLDKDPRNANILSEVYKNTNYVVAKDNILYVYKEEDGCFYQSDYNEIASDIKASLDEEIQSKISTRDYKEAFDQLTISKELSADAGFFENMPFVNCLNGVVSVKDGELLEHSPDFRFKHCIQANYAPDSECPKFMDYVEYITNGDKELKKLLRVIMGYLFSHFTNAKMAVLIYGIPHTGKSVLCSLISRIIGEQHVTNIDLGMLHRQEYAATLSNAILNVAPDLKNEALRDVGFFKSLVSKDDVIMARTLYSNPIKVKCEIKMLFSSNHLISFSPDVGIYDIEAVFNRLLYFPFQNPPVKDSENNKHLSEELYEERDAIFTWAMGGLKYYVEHNENFPECTLSTETKMRNMAQFCPEKVFFSEAIKSADGKYESSSAIKEAFEVFCSDIGAKVKGDIHAYLAEHEGIVKLNTKKRIDSDGNLTGEGNPIYVYEGIRLRKKYKINKNTVNKINTEE